MVKHFCQALCRDNEIPQYLLCSSCTVTLFHLFVFFSQVRLLLELYRLQGNMTRVKINELKPLKPRFEVPDVLVKEPTTEPYVSQSY